ncbi:MAG: hypothetical protein GX943_01060 [Candidatus Pacebacteria bacterium]|nr:hypothetical protein [Candidatus Paceibacterota bacterium]
MKNKKNLRPLFLISLFVLSFLFSILLLGVTLVKAEEPAVKTDLIWQKERLEEDIAKTRQNYSQSLEDYRNQERFYIIAYDQHVSLKTLASLEDLVIKTKAVSLSRDQALINYLELLKLNLYASEGVELLLKNQYLGLLEEKINGLKKHRQELEGKNSQKEVQSSLDDFVQYTDLDKISEQVLALLALSRLQRIYDLALPLKKDIDKLLDVGESSALSALLRASEETDKTLSQAQNNLNLLWEKSKRANSLESIYRNLTKELNPVYINLSQSLAYLEELMDFK